MERKETGEKVKCNGLRLSSPDLFSFSWCGQRRKEGGGCM
uniref:Uncharacterized protein n=1 Tax=Arundo donax TaxID=35708 RepID=A0A0A8XVD5_ARUDO